MTPAFCRSVRRLVSRHKRLQSNMLVCDSSHREFHPYPALNQRRLKPPPLPRRQAYSWGPNVVQPAANWSTIGGGLKNSAGGFAATVAGGFGNTASGNYSDVGGGTDNSAQGDYSNVAGGNQNISAGFLSVIAGGGADSNVGAGSNQALGEDDVVSGGRVISQTAIRGRLGMYSVW